MNDDVQIESQDLKINCPSCDQHLVLENPELFKELDCPNCGEDLSLQLRKPEASEPKTSLDSNIVSSQSSLSGTTETHKELSQKEPDTEVAAENIDLTLLEDTEQSSSENSNNEKQTIADTPTHHAHASDDLASLDNKLDNLVNDDLASSDKKVDDVSAKVLVKEDLTKSSQELSLLCGFCNQKLILESPELFEKIICPGCQVDISDQKPTKVISSSFKKPSTEVKTKVDPPINFAPDKKDPEARKTSATDSVEKKVPEGKKKKPASKSKSKSKGLSVSKSAVKKINNKRPQAKGRLAPVMLICALVLGGLIYKSKDLQELFNQKNKVSSKPVIKAKPPAPKESPVVEIVEIPKQQEAIILEVEEELKPLVIIDDMEVPESALLNKAEIKTLISKLKTHCYDCHGNDVHEEDLNFEALKGADDYYKKYNIFKQSLAFIRASEMPPPEDGELEDQEKEEFAELVQKLLFTIETKSRKVSKKPKIQRLNSKNYNTTVKAVTGLDFDFSKKFQIDNTNDISIVSFEKFLGSAEFISRYANYDLDNGFLFNEKPTLKHPKNVLLKKLKTAQYKYLPSYYFKDFNHEEALRRSMLALANFHRDGDKQATMLNKISIRNKISPLFVQQTAAFIKKFSLDTAITKGLKDWKKLSIKKYPKELVKPAIESFITHWKSSLEELENNKKLTNLKRKQIQNFDKLISNIFILPPSIVEKELSPENVPKYNELEEFIVFLEHKKLSKNFTIKITQQSRAFLDKLLRRPATENEVKSFANAFLQLSYDHGSDNAVQLMMTQSFLRTEFLFRFEKKTPEFKKLSAFELANRLSYLIWNQPPDQQLYELASSGEIFNRQVLIDQVQYMLRDKRSQAMLKAFLNKWLEVDTLRDMAEEDPIYEDMYQEIITFFDYVVKNDLNLQNLLDSDFTFLNDHMAEFYSIETDVGYVFRKRPLNTDKRGGITGMAGFMALSSAGEETNPILRGNFILSSILGTPTPPPPPDAGILPTSSETKGQTLRQVLEEHRKNPNCKGCHMLIDPLGFPLENYDHMGKWRDNVDNHAKLANGKEITGPKELRRYLIKNRDHFYRKISSAFLAYAMNRELNHYDFYLVNKCHTNLRHNNNRFSAIVATIILSDQFQYKL